VIVSSCLKCCDKQRGDTILKNISTPKCEILLICTMKDKKERVSESLRRVLSFDLIPKMLNALASLPGFFLTNPC
jgi:hypothetical protein